MTSIRQNSLFSIQELYDMEPTQKYEAIISVNENEIEVANYLKDLFAQYGIESKIVPVTDTRVNLVAEIGSGSPVIGISGHMDVVSPGDESDWTSDPFTLTERDGKLYG